MYSIPTLLSLSFLSELFDWQPDICDDPDSVTPEATLGSHGVGVASIV